MQPGILQPYKIKILKLHHDFAIRYYKFGLYQLDSFNILLRDENIHYEMYRRLLHELKCEIPGLVVSMDVTRRNRPNLDFGLDFGRLFIENRGRKEFDHRRYQPYLTLRNLWSVIKYAPANKLEIEVMPQIEDSEYNLEYIIGTTVFGNPLYWGALAEMPEIRQQAMKDFYAKLAPHRNEIASGLVFTAGEKPALGNTSTLVSVSADFPEKISGYISIYRNGGGDSSFDVPLLLRKYNLAYTPVIGNNLTVTEGKVNATFTSDFVFQLHCFKKA